MTAPVRRCQDHGAFDAGEETACPVCDDEGAVVLTGDRRARLSKFLSGALRHFPGDVGLPLDEAGWTDYGAVVRAAEDQYEWVDPAHVDWVVETDPKGRFERREGTDGGTRVRAAYGHSVDVDLDARAGDDTEATDEGTGRADESVPSRLYHGTAPDNVDAIRTEGLRPMGRQLVHLSGTVEAARTVGARHAHRPAVFVVDAEAMLSDGYELVERGQETYTTETVPPKYLSLLEE